MPHLGDLWLRGQAVQASALQLAAYNAAFLGTASLQAMRLGLTAPQGFWAALARAPAEPEGRGGRRP